MSNDRRFGKVEAYAQDIPPGVCQCGCGQKTQVITASVARQGRVRGEFSRFVQHHRTSPYGQDIFTPAWARSEAGAWFLGLFMTDGTLDKSRVLRISLKDRDAVEAAARALGGDKSVVKRNFPPNDSQWLLSVSLKSVWPRAESLGLWAGAKSGREFVPVGLQDNPHFWRGCVEGDGWVSADPRLLR